MAQPAAALRPGGPTGNGPGSAGVKAPRPPGTWARLSGGHVAMVMAGVLAAVANVGVLRALDERQVVLVVAAPVAAGQAVTRADFASAQVRLGKDLLATVLPADRAGEVPGWVAVTALAPGEIVRRSDLRPPSAPARLRAMSLPVAAEHAAGGAIAAGDRVDVIAVRDGAAAYVVTDVAVLGVAGGQGSAVLATAGGLALTLAVDAAQALRLAEALHSGAVEVVRSTGAPPVAAGADHTAAGADHTAVEQDQAAAAVSPPAGQAGG